MRERTDQSVDLLVRWIGKARLCHVGILLLLLQLLLLLVLLLLHLLLLLLLGRCMRWLVCRQRS